MKLDNSVRNSTAEPDQLLLAIDRHRVTRPDSIAIVTSERLLSWKELAQQVDQLVAALSADGLKKGDRCAIVAGNTIEHIVVMLSIARAGGVVIPMSLMLTSETLYRLIDDSEPSFLFFDSSGKNILKEQSFPDCIKVDMAAPEALRQLSVDNLSTMPDYSDIFSIIYSSGTTGVPKGIVHTHRARSMYGVVFSQEYGIDQNSRVLLSTPLYSNASWMLLLPAIFSGATVVLMDKHRPTEFGLYVSKYEVTHAFLVPTQIHDLLTLPNEVQGSPFPPVVISAGSRLELSLKRRILELGSTELFELYGNTEGVASLLRPRQIPASMDSVGTAIATGEIRIIDDDGRLVGHGVEGEIVGCNALMSSGYFKRDDLNQELFWKDDAGKMFVRTGDIGAIVKGFLVLKGRKKDMLLSGGVNVYPIDIESILLAHPDVCEAAVVPKPHPRWSETPYAFVVVNAKTDQDRLIEWVNPKLNAHQRLSGLSIVDSLPRNALGKVIKFELAQRLIEGRGYEKQ